MIDLKQYSPSMQSNIELFYEKCFNDLGWGYEPHSRHSDTVNIQQEYMKNGCFWCLYDGKQLIGTVAIRTIDLQNKIAELKRLYVLKEMQGKGYGGLLFDIAVNYAKNNGYCKICADTRNDRSASQHLMRKYGFFEVPQYNDNAYAELFFELPLMSN